MTDYLVLDIETVVKREITEKDEKYLKVNKTLKDPKKIKIDKEKKMGFQAGVPEIVSIAYSVVDANTHTYAEEPKGMTSLNEKEILDWFSAEVKEYDYAKLCGFNIKGFDYPHLVVRCSHHSVSLPWRVGKWDMVDLMEYPYYNQGGLKQICYWRGIKQEVMGSELLGLTMIDGSNVAQMWEEERYAELVAYNIEDVRMTSELLLKTLPYYKL